MLTIDNLETVVDAIVATIPELEQEVQYVIDDDQLTEKADAYKGDKHLLLCLVPSAQGFGAFSKSGVTTLDYNGYVRTRRCARLIEVLLSCRLPSII